MDLIHSLTADLGTTPDKARRVAGRLLAWIEIHLQRSFGDEAAQEFMNRLPLVEQWREMVPIAVESTEVDEILVGTGIDPISAGIAVPVVDHYLRSRLPPELLRQVLHVAPFLMGAAPEHRPRSAASRDNTTYAPD